MKIRAPRPIKAVKSIYRAYKGDVPELYRIDYVVDTDETGQLIWIERTKEGTVILKNSHAITMEPGRRYAIVDQYMTELNNESLPMYELKDINVVEQEHNGIVEIPVDWIGETLPVVDRMDYFE